MWCSHELFDLAENHSHQPTPNILGEAKTKKNHTCSFRSSRTMFIVKGHTLHTWNSFHFLCTQNNSTMCLSTMGMVFQKQSLSVRKKGHNGGILSRSCIVIHIICFFLMVGCSLQRSCLSSFLGWLLNRYSYTKKYMTK